MTSSEYRRCPVTGRTVVLAPRRAERPMELRHAEPHHRNRVSGGHCPFCPGSEAETPPELFAIRDEAGWQLRVVPNKFPAVDPKSGAFGFHEVLIECSEHFASPTDLSNAQFANIFTAYRERLLHHAADPRIASVSVFKNVGAEAGASLAHLHSQLVALPFVPEPLQQELAATDCRHCGGHDPTRVVAESPHFIAVCPYAPRFAYEMWVLPKDHRPRFETICEVEELAALMKQILTALDRVLNFPAYNWVLHTAPRGDFPYFHWRFEVFPRLSRVAGFEWGSGVFINDVFPERAARELRDAILRGQ
ncbi:galactose-1-phosphate uridylyltransferase [Limnoglobus roseus]|uniref:Galactose-1-phosphate uridylyltransferase n=1 Tax=Limnoglobus roseus TaxID=2598579 RepID=A0A5C1A863_9BACT|nr:DUF4921 family protein [Limnoglobus roseus]QEL15519.1 galactose-1-phosphate uridylyltransferase [Limnoglobus roseus]